MVEEEIKDGVNFFFPRFAAFGGAFFEEIFCGNDDDDRAAPIGDGIAEEGAAVCFGIRVFVEDDPQNQNEESDQGKGVIVEEVYRASPPVLYGEEGFSSGIPRAVVVGVFRLAHAFVAEPHKAESGELMLRFDDGDLNGEKPARGKAAGGRITSRGVSGRKVCAISR
jgi:hypothetical protein